MYMFLDGILTNLGIYGNNDCSKHHIAQGITFAKYGKEYETVKGNNHPYLQFTSSPSLSSITEAFTSITQTQTDLLKNEDIFNQKLNNYSTAYKLYNTFLLNIQGPLSADDLKKNTQMKADLLIKNADLMNIGKLIIADMNELQGQGQGQGQDSSLRQVFDTNKSDLNDSLDKLLIERNKFNTMTIYDQDTIDGSLETTALNTNSIFYHYLVLIIVSITLLSFTFNLLVNPEADVLKALYVIGALIAVYIISTYIS